MIPSRYRHFSTLPTHLNVPLQSQEFRGWFPFCGPSADNFFTANTQENYEKLVTYPVSVLCLIAFGGLTTSKGSCTHVSFQSPFSSYSVCAFGSVVIILGLEITVFWVYGVQHYAGPKNRNFPSREAQLVFLLRFYFNLAGSTRSPNFNSQK